MLVGLGAVGELGVLGVLLQLGAGELDGDDAEHGQLGEGTAVGGEVGARP